jgi:hypothetical protein
VPVVPRFVCATLLVIAAATAAAARDPAGPEPVAFRRRALTGDFHAEAVGIGDIDKDGKADVVYGPFWYAGPEFRVRHPIYPAQVFDPHKYSDNFMTAIGDIDADGWLDVAVNEWPGKAVHWFRNPGRDGLAANAAWARHLAHPAVDNESPAFVDVTGDGKPELVFHTGGVLGFATPNPATATDRWTFHPCSEPETWGQYQHGLGVGDVDGDGRRDLLMVGGWWRQPADGRGQWAKQPHAFGGQGGAQIHVYDVDGDGDGDVITSLAGHGYGLSWYEQVRRDGAIDFVAHPILPAKAEESLDGVQFSQLHAVEVADIDGDGLKDIVTGKRYWAHGPQGDPDPGGAPVLYWFQLQRRADAEGNRAAGVRFVPHRIDDTAGVGTQIAVGDVDGDGRADVVVGNKKGASVFLRDAPARP